MYKANWKSNVAYLKIFRKNDIRRKTALFSHSLIYLYVVYFKTQDKYKQYCQHVFDLQNEVLASVENLSTDEGSDNEDTDNEDMASKLEKMLGNEKSQAKGRSKIAGLTGKKVGEVEEEEKERLALQRMIHGDVEAVKLDDKKNDAKKGLFRLHSV
jgi:ubiquitin